MWYAAGILCFVCAAANLDAQSAHERTWDIVGRVPASQRVNVWMQDGKNTSGTIAQWTDNTLVLRQRRGRERTIQKLDVQRISYRRKSARWKDALIGAGVGFAVMFPIGAAKAGTLSDQNNPSFGTRMGMGAALGLFGAGIGGAAGAIAGGSRETVVYEAPRTKR